ncbi:MAG TPA: hypothetical protein PLY54_15060 [Ottowia sp.]|jgi:hypothetical protein|nr:hypothetical protein [Ottowia sp.]
MNFRSPTTFPLAALAVAAAALSPTVASAQSQAPAAAGNPWQVGLSIYGYFPTMGGTTSFPTLPSNPSPGINVDAQTILDHLKMTFMGSLDIHNGRWGGFTDVLYVNVGATKSKTRDFHVADQPASLTADLSLDVKITGWTTAAEYRLATGDPAFTADLLGGVRLLNVKNSLGWSFSGAAGSHPLEGRSGNTVVEQSVWDAIVGVKGTYAFGAERKWFVPYYFDIGTGQSKLTYQVAAGVGYKYQWGEVAAVWRYIDYDMKSGKPIQSVSFNGPQIGATWRW